jgi:hypothetical protein
MLLNPGGFLLLDGLHDLINLGPFFGLFAIGTLHCHLDLSKGSFWLW